MAQVKKAYASIMTLAQKMIAENDQVTLQDFLSKALPLMLPKAGGGGGSGAQKVIVDENNQIIALHCAWFDCYFRVENFGKKASTKNGFNSYSAMGLSARNQFFNNREKLITETRDLVFDGQLDIAEGKERIAELQDSIPDKSLPDELKAYVVNVEDGELVGDLPEVYNMSS